MNKDYCSKCCKCMTDNKGNNLFGVVITVNMIPDDSFNREFIQEQLGTYTIGVNYKFCFECLLDTLFGE